MAATLAPTPGPRRASMRWLYGLVLVLGVAPWTFGCASASRAPSPEVRLRCERPMSVLELLKLAQGATGGIYLLRAEVPEGTEVSWQGDVLCRQDEVDDFVRALLRTKGFDLRARRHGDVDVREVVARAER